MGESGLEFRSQQASPSCSETTPRTTHFVSGSWPMSFVTCNPIFQNPLAWNHGLRAYLRVSLDDGHPPRPVRLLSHQPQEVLWVLRGPGVALLLLSLAVTVGIPAGELRTARGSAIGQGLRAAEEAEVWCFRDSCEEKG